MRIVLLTLVAAALIFFFAWQARAVEPVNTGTFNDVAIKGYDPVSYFDGRPVEGSKEITHTWKGAEWRFSTAENRERFLADPQAFAPQYGGYCAWAVAQGSTAGIDPEAWKIVDGKLYLNYSKKIQRRWEADMAALIEKADAEWPKLLSD